MIQLRADHSLFEARFGMGASGAASHRPEFQRTPRSSKSWNASPAMLMLAASAGLAVAPDAPTAATLDGLQPTRRP